MKTPRSPSISGRKKPRQERSTRLVEDILEAAIRVLVHRGKGGPKAFTTVNVAEEAGVSVGSLYQYFPNKAALLFRLQSDEWNDTWGVVDEVLHDVRHPPLDRLRRAVHAFFRSEAQEASLRASLDAIGAPFRASPEARSHVERATASVRTFLDDAIPGASPEHRAFTAELLMVSLGAIAERLTTERPHLPRADLDAWARATGDMFAAYLTPYMAREDG